MTPLNLNLLFVRDLIPGMLYHSGGICRSDARVTLVIANTIHEGCHTLTLLDYEGGLFTYADMSGDIGWVDVTSVVKE
jgi:hypothetical protein